MIEAKVISINMSNIKGIMKTPIEAGVFIKNVGLEGDAHAGMEIRQVSLLALESIKKMEDKLGHELKYGSFAENVTTKGIILHQLEIGTIIRIGETIQEVSKIGKECNLQCEISRKVGMCIMPKEGIFTKVLKGGLVKVGDKIIIEKKKSLEKGLIK